MNEAANLIELTADIVSAHVGNNNVAVGDVGNLVRQVHEALLGLGATPSEPEPEAAQPAVSVRSSIRPDVLVCLQCGAKQKTLKRHLATAHDMTPQDYRERFGLRPEYPMVAPNYSKRRSEMARSIGLGKARKEETGKRVVPARKSRARKTEAGATK